MENTRVEQNMAKQLLINEDYYARVEQNIVVDREFRGRGMHSMQASYILDLMIKGLMLT